MRSCSCRSLETASSRRPSRFAACLLIIEALLLPALWGCGGASADAPPLADAAWDVLAERADAAVGADGAGDAKDEAGTSCRADPGGCWRPLPLEGAPAARAGHTGVFAGDRFIVWGGVSRDVAAGALSSGASLVLSAAPRGPLWEPTAPAPMVPGRSAHAAVWTGSRLFVWGGLNEEGDSEPGRIGGLFDPKANVWGPTTQMNVPSGRAVNGAVWTGSKVVLWGGSYDLAPGYQGTGAAYDPAADAWTPVSSAGAPSARFNHTGVWTGTLLLVWGGEGAPNANRSGGAYDPLQDKWRPIAPAGAPALSRHTAVWTGSLMVVWGGPAGTAGAYDPATDAWSPVTTQGAPSARTEHVAVWTGREMLVWGGRDEGGHELGDGALYDPARNRWRPLSTSGAPSARMGAAAAWTGQAMIVWGGSSGSGGVTKLADGGWYEPPP